jgi:rhodanese-related sulfurtransferase
MYNISNYYLKGSLIMSEMLKQSSVSSRELEILLKEREEGNADFLLVDVREMMEYDSGHITGADMLKPTSLFQSWSEEFLKLYKEKTVIFTCRSGNRSGQVQNVFKKNGMENVINHAGGIISYSGETQLG